MTLPPGARLGPYEILSALGAGGMGEVYRARDTRLDRTVAIKVLSAQLAGDKQLRDRFDREARAISSLNHPHICALYDVGEVPVAPSAGVDQSAVSGADPLRFLVLEYIEGETVADRLARSGAIAPGEALRIAIEICDALDRAHRSGIVHRDLKPANVMLTKSGAKLLDFGLAKSGTPVVAASGLSMLPTTPPDLTAQGAILGTFQYMAPEQIEGLEADARTDIFAFGALLFEMLTGRTAFAGKTRASLLGAILKDEPPRVSTVEPIAPPALDRVVSTCLAKDPDDRYQSSRDLLRDLRWAAAGQTAEAVPVAAPAPVRASRVAWVIAAVLSVALVAMGIAFVRQPKASGAEPVAFTLAPPDNLLFAGLPGGGTGVAAQLAVSPDGRQLVAVAGGANGYQLWLRPLRSAGWTAIPGTEDSAFPFWSPDSRSVGFFAGGSLKTVPINGGPPVILCEAVRGLGGTWSQEGVIVFGVTPDSGGSVLLRVSANGGTPVPATVLDTTTGETSHRWPQFLPDGRHFLFTAATGTCCPPAKPAVIRVGSLDSTDMISLFQAESSAAYAAGHLLFARNGTLMAQRFDPVNRRTTGDPFPVVDRVASEGSRYASVSLSESGVLAYARGQFRITTRLTWLDRSGAPIGTVGEPASYLSLALAPDNGYVAVSMPAGNSENRAIWIFDLQRGGMSRLTFDAVDDQSPVWSPDGSRVAFYSVRPRDASLRQQSVKGIVNDEPLLPGPQFFPSDWSADGRFITFNRNSSSSDVWILPLSGDRKPFALAQTRFSERNGVFAPDGRWIAYQSNETGQSQVYVQPFPPTDRKYLVSIDGGEQPTWSADGKELFFISPDSKMMVAAIDTAREFKASTPRALFSAPALGNGSSTRQYAVSKDGKRFLVNARTERSNATALTVVVNWPVTVQQQASRDPAR